MTMPLLDCPGHNIGGTYIPGCGRVTAIYRVRKIRLADDVTATIPVMVCPHCKTRLLPTPAEIARTRGVA